MTNEVCFVFHKTKARIRLITFPSLRLKSQFSEIFTTFEERISDINDLLLILEIECGLSKVTRLESFSKMWVSSKGFNVFAENYLILTF